MSKEEDILIEIRDELRLLRLLFAKNLKIRIATDTTGRARKASDEDNGEPA